MHSIHAIERAKRLRTRDALSNFLIGDKEETELAKGLYRVNTETYNRVARAELERLGQPVPFTLTNPQIMRGLGKEAARSAASIRRTFNRELRGAARSIRELNPGMTQKQFIDRLQEWFTQRQTHKGRQVAITEAYKIQQRATMEFYDKAGLTARFWFGGSLMCPRCKAIAAGNPYTQEAARALPAPIHVGCGDAWSAELIGPAPSGRLWTGK